jgi:hypothetical protein
MSRRTFPTSAAPSNPTGFFFGSEPATQRGDYGKFELDHPPLVLCLNRLQSTKRARLVLRELIERTFERTFSAAYLKTRMVFAGMTTLADASNPCIG